MKKKHLSFLLLLLFACNQAPHKVREIKPLVTKIKIKDFEITGKGNLLLRYRLEQIKNTASDKQQVWALKLTLSLNSSQLKDTVFYKKSKYLAISELLKELMAIPYKNPMSVNFKYNGNGFSTVDEIEGTKIDTSMLRSSIINVYENNIQKINLTTESLYIKPTYNLNSPKTIDGKKALEKSLFAIITLNSSQGNYVINKTVFGECLKLDTSMKILVDVFPLQKHLQNIASQLEVPMSEILKANPIVDSSLNTDEIIFSRINISAQVNEIIKAIIRGGQSSQNLLFYSRGLPKGFIAGYENFVEISIKEQKLWLFKNGNLILETDVVTGNARLNRSTPPGNYSILSKNRNATLRGPGYACPVNYWMPFFQGYGLHDANWRRRFGASIFENSGSHGCINLPPRNAPIVFANVEVGTPVIIY